MHLPFALGLPHGGELGALFLLLLLPLALLVALWRIGTALLRLSRRRRSDPGND